MSPIGQVNVDNWALNLSSSWVTLRGTPDPLYTPRDLPALPKSTVTMPSSRNPLPLRGKQFYLARPLVLPAAPSTAGSNRPPVIGYHTTDATGATRPPCPCCKNNPDWAGQHFFIGNLKLPDP